ncbi:MAG: Fe-S oxidoreductase [Betaproteobacteria bacterium]|nr:Fe-S oxidoreductase [Betaproteobacteria bacterium]
MAQREGSLEAPTRHALDWKNPKFYDEADLFHELERVYDICHGCRRCVSLCTAFPTLFGLVDESETMEVDGVKKADYWKVVDQCYLCDLCFMTKCPYVPPHEWTLDFPHLMLRAKALKYKKGEVSFRDKLLSSTDALGKLASIPVVTQVTNFAIHNGAARSVMDGMLAIHKARKLPEYAGRTFRSSAKPRNDFPAKPGERTPGKVAIYATCYVNYNEPGIGHDLIKLLEHNEIPSIVVEKEACCGMPKLELGDLETVAKHKAINIPVLAKLAREGYAILTAVPSCTLMFKQELPLMFPDDADVKAVREAMFDPFEYLMLRHADGLLKTDFKEPLGNVSYHVPCHLRVQNMGNKTRDALKLAGAEVNLVERCSGHDGTWGVKKEYFGNSMKIGKPVFKQMGDKAPKWISSDCAIAGRHIQQGMGEAGEQAKKEHPLTLLRIAYGL